MAAYITEARAAGGAGVSDEALGALRAQLRAHEGALAAAGAKAEELEHVNMLLMDVAHRRLMEPGELSDAAEGLKSQVEQLGRRDEALAVQAQLLELERGRNDAAAQQLDRRQARFDPARVAPAAALSDRHAHMQAQLESDTALIADQLAVWQVALADDTPQKALEVRTIRS